MKKFFLLSIFTLLGSASFCKDTKEHDKKEGKLEVIQKDELKEVEDLLNVKPEYKAYVARQSALLISSIADLLNNDEFGLGEETRQVLENLMLTFYINMSNVDEWTKNLSDYKQIAAEFKEKFLDEYELISESIKDEQGNVIEIPRLIKKSELQQLEKEVGEIESEEDLDEEPLED
jgi:hypothetical protein